MKDLPVPVAGEAPTFLHVEELAAPAAKRINNLYKMTFKPEGIAEVHPAEGNFVVEFNSLTVIGVVAGIVTYIDVIAVPQGPVV